MGRLGGLKKGARAKDGVWCTAADRICSPLLAARSPLAQADGGGHPVGFGNDCRRRGRSAGSVEHAVAAARSIPRLNVFRGISIMVFFLERALACIAWMLSSSFHFILFWQLELLGKVEPLKSKFPVCLFL